eukprot:3473855-Pleurochrysis_carterae.AAC.1
MSRSYADATSSSKRREMLTHDMRREMEASICKSNFRAPKTALTHDAHCGKWIRRQDSLLPCNMQHAIPQRKSVFRSGINFTEKCLPSDSIVSSSGC